MEFQRSPHQHKTVDYHRHTRGFGNVARFTACALLLLAPLLGSCSATSPSPTPTPDPFTVPRALNLGVIQGDCVVVDGTLSSNAIFDIFDIFASNPQEIYFYKDGPDNHAVPYGVCYEGGPSCLDSRADAPITPDANGPTIYACAPP